MNDRTDTLEIRQEVAEKIWAITRISTEHNNALMDIIGYPTYCYLADLARYGKDSNDSRFK